MIFYNSEQIPGVAHNEPVHFPLALDHIHHRRMQNNRYAIKRIVGGHHRLCAAFLEGRLEGFQIIFTQIARVNAGRIYSAVNLIIVAEKMLQRCYRFQVHRMITLNSLNQCSA
ncbi:hypothetical protein D3C80_1614430 [compost metagenome]